MRVLAWNVQSGGAKRAAHITSTIDAANPDVVALTEVRASSAVLLKDLERYGFGSPAVSYGTSRCGGSAILSRLPMTESKPLSTQAHFPGRLVEVRIPRFAVSIVALYGPLQTEDHNGFWTQAAEILLARRDSRTVVVGDFNTGESVRDARSKRFFCSDHFATVKSHGYVDAWRHVHGDAREYSWYSRIPAIDARNGFRLDHALVSPSLVPHIADARYVHSARMAKISDHSPLILELDDRV